jgi:hypothetical protein
MKNFEKWDKEMRELNEKIMDLRTELYIMEGRRRDLYEERMTYIDGLQAQLNKKDKENGR